VHNFNISEREIISLGEQRFSWYLLRIGETITKVKRRTMAALSVFAPRRTGQFCLFRVSRNPLDIRAREIDRTRGCAKISFLASGQPGLKTFTAEINRDSAWIINCGN
jgi:hypothetical protein